MVPRAKGDKNRTDAGEDQPCDPSRRRHGMLATRLTHPIVVCADAGSAAVIATTKPFGTTCNVTTDPPFVGCIRPPTRNTRETGWSSGVTESILPEGTCTIFPPGMGYFHGRFAGVSEIAGLPRSWPAGSGGAWWHAAPVRMLAGTLPHLCGTPELPWSASYFELAEASTSRAGAPHGAVALNTSHPQSPQPDDKSSPALESRCVDRAGGLTQDDGSRPGRHPARRASMSSRRPWNKRRAGRGVLDIRNVNSLYKRQ